MGLAHTIVGIVGNVISFGLFLSPMPTFFQIYKKKAVEEFQAYPYLGTVMNCIIWIFYGLPIIKKDNILVLTINSVGLVIELLYLSVYVVYANDRKKRVRVACILIFEAVLTAGIVLVAFFVFYSHRTLMVGIIADVFNIIMYGSPLAIATKVIKTRSVEYMPFWLSLAAFSNGICWTIYGLLQFDIFILVSNGLGAISGFLQLCLYAYFYFKGNHKTKDQVKKPSAEVRVACILIFEAVLTAGIVLVAFFVFYSHRTLMVGIIADVFNIIMYGSPLAIATKVIKTRSVEYMPFWLSLAAFSNGICWTIYGLLQFDIFILVSNGLGAISGFLQLCLYAYFYFKGNHKTKDQVKKQSAEVQLSTLPIGAA